MINKISDIVIGQEYVILLIDDMRLAKKCTVLGIINESEKFNSDRTEIFVQIKGRQPSKNLLFFKEIGIGEDKKDSLKNYGKFIFEENSNFSTSFEAVKKNFQN